MLEYVALTGTDTTMLYTTIRLRINYRKRWLWERWDV